MARRLRYWFAGLAVVAVSLVGLPAAAGAQTADTDRSPHWSSYWSSLRHLAAARGVYVGAAVAPGPLTDERQYRRTLARQFNSVTPENAMKWAVVEPERGEYDWSNADQIVEFAQRHHQRVYGHVLLWHSQLPSWLTEGDFPPDELRNILREHIKTEVGRYRGQVAAWDVVNEPFNEDGTMRETMWLEKLGPDYIAKALRWAHQADPHAKLYINDYNVEGINAKSDAMYELARSLLRRGVPLDGVGLQGHLILGQTPDDIKENIQRFADLGLDVAITELDIRMDLPVTEEKLKTQAEEYGQVMEACLAVSRCVSVTTWGFTDKHSWIPGFFEGQGAALPYDENYRPKPAYFAMRDALSCARDHGRHGRDDRGRGHGRGGGWWGDHDRDRGWWGDRGPGWGGGWWDDRDRCGRHGRGDHPGRGDHHGGGHHGGGHHGFSGKAAA